MEEVFQMKKLAILFAVGLFACGSITNTVMTNDPNKGYTELCRTEYGTVDAKGNTKQYLMIRIMDYENDKCNEIHINKSGKEQAKIVTIPMMVCSDVCDDLQE